MMKLNANEKNLLRKNLNLSERQAQIVELLLDGIEASPRIAARLGISQTAINLYLHKIYRKLGVTCRLQVALKVLMYLGYIPAS